MPTLAEMLRQGSWNTDSGDTTSQLVNALRGAAETGATLGTGALAGLAGMPYGIYKSITSGAYGTPEAPRIAAKEAQQFMERNIYQPRTEQGQEYVQKLGRLFEESKLPPVMPEAAVLGAIPKQAYAAQAERAGMAAEKALEPAIMRTMERGGKPAQLLEDLAQGTRRQIFIGENAKTWDKVAAENAAKLEKAGVTPEEIWKETGTFKGPEGKWRQEISDLTARANFPPAYSDVLNAHSQFEYGKPYHSLPFGEVGLGEARKKISSLADADMERYKTASGSFPHPDLFKEYPELANIKTDPYKDTGISGNYQKTEVSEGNLQNPQVKVTNESITAGAPNENDLKSVLAHEMQHAVQTREGFAKGGSPSEYSKVAEQIREHQKAFNYALENRMNSKDPISKDNYAQVMAFHGSKMNDLKNQFGKDQNEFYNRLAGEAEARATQKRLNMTPEQRRAKFPYESYDVPKEQLIVRGMFP